MQLFVIAGPNGAGKTTTIKTLLPTLLHCEEYVNADHIAQALSPFHPESVAIQAGKLMLRRTQHLAAHHINFAFETTLSAKTFAPFLENCKKEDYTVTIIFFWLI
jgi:predicted ABC-type ATPase